MLTGSLVTRLYKISEWILYFWHQNMFFLMALSLWDLPTNQEPTKKNVYIID